MDPPDAPDDYRHDDIAAPDDGDDVGGSGGTVELKPLVSSARGRGADAPEDPPLPPRHISRTEPEPGKVAYAKNTGDESTGERVVSALSNEGIINVLQRATIGIQGLFTRTGVEETPPPAAVPPPAASNNGGSDDYDDEAENSGKKKMMLLLMATLFVSLMGAVLGKHSALEVELGVEEGETEQAFHQHSKEGDVLGGDDKPAHHFANMDGYQPKEMLPQWNYTVPGTEDAPPLSAASGRPYYRILNHFQHRDPNSAYAKTWGFFDFQDPSSKYDGKMRPQPNFEAAPNRDVQNSDFPEDAWQGDKEYMEAFLKEAKKLVKRQIEAIYGEYGVGLPEDGSVTLSDEELAHRKQFFPWQVVQNIAQAPRGGNWMTQQSMDGTARRMIHHIMTGDTFQLTLGGHSAAAGHGAGFNQSYIIEAGNAVEPVFAHLGVDFWAYNFAQGGMGTFQQSLAGMDLRGKDTDWIMWDSRMTERPENLVNFFLRQALISGNRAPVLMGDGAQLGGFHNTAGAAVCGQGQGWVPVSMSDAQARTLPWAAQWLQCGRGSTANCAGKQYTAGCWTPRPDFTPPRAQGKIVGGAAAWHPGNRIHKRRGRQIALIILHALQYAIDKWEELGTENGYPIPEDQWHVSDYYRNIREKTKTVGGCWGNQWRTGQGRALEETDSNHTHTADDRKLADDFWPARLCNLPLQGRSMWGPRYEPMKSSLLSIMKKNKFGDKDPNLKKKWTYMEPTCEGYTPPDVPAPWFVAKAPEPYSPLIGGSRRLNGTHFVEEEQEKKPLLRRAEETHDQTSLKGTAQGNEGLRGLQDAAAAPAEKAAEVYNPIEPGLGVEIQWGRAGVCDGSSHHWCDKPCGSGCLMGGAQDNRGMLCFNGLSGWVVFELKNVNHGFIGARLESWRKKTQMKMTWGWKGENNGGKGNYARRGRDLREFEEHIDQKNEENLERMKQEIEEEVEAEGDEERRRLLEDRRFGAERRRLGGGQSCGIAGDFNFEFAINNGTITTWNQGQFCQHYTRLNYNLDVVKFLDDPTKTGDMEIAMRMTTPAGEGQVMCMTHLYWS